MMPVHEHDGAVRRASGSRHVVAGLVALTVLVLVLDRTDTLLAAAAPLANSAEAPPPRSTDMTAVVDSLSSLAGNAVETLARDARSALAPHAHGRTSSRDATPR
jgi:hypothetical protein